ncbi:MAG TPA: DUF4350 domain-containing protein [Rhodanobacteraceae bacterium]|nr:DUF4350 domain-containing protein [Rhodanobacteraceae bacterium]
MRRAWRSWVYALACVVIAVCVAALAARVSFSADWSAGARATISPASRALLKQLQGPLQAVAYARPGPLRAKTRLLIERYQRFKPDLKLSFVDPDVDPVATQDAGITADGEVVLHWHDQTQDVAQLDERGIGDALVRLARGGTQLVAFVTGQGERSAAGIGAADLGNFVNALAARGVRAVPLNLAEAAEVPRNARLVVLASPQAALSPASVQKLSDYVANGGNLLWLTEPGSDDLGLATFAQALGIKRLPGMLLDAQGGARDPRMLVATRYPAQAITDGFDINTEFPQVAALAKLGDAQWDVQPLLQSSAQSWNQSASTGLAATTSLPSGPSAGELKGPLNFGYALTRLSPSPARNQQRVVVIGDGDFLSNAYLGDAGNLAFGERMVDWLLGDDALASTPPEAPDSRLRPSATDLAVLTFGYLIGLPILLIVLGGWIGWRRRRR